MTKKAPRSLAKRWAASAAALLAVAILLGVGPPLWTIARLGNMGHGSGSSLGVPYATKQLGSRYSFIRRCAAEALGTVGPSAEAAVPRLIESLEDESPEVALSAAWALGNIQSPREEAIEALIVSLHHEHPLVQQYAAYALGLYGSKAYKAIPDLYELSRSGGPGVASQAHDSLGRVKPWWMRR